MIGTSPKGELMTRKHLFIEDEHLFNLTFEPNYKCIDEAAHEPEILNEEFEDVSMKTSMIYEVVEVGKFVGLLSSRNSSELFYLAEVEEKGIAKEDDWAGHHVLKGEEYMRVRYLELQSAKKDKVVYKYSKAKPALIHVGEVFATNVEVLYGNIMSPMSTIVC